MNRDPCLDWFTLLRGYPFKSCTVFLYFCPQSCARQRAAAGPPLPPQQRGFKKWNV